MFRPSFSRRDYLGAGTTSILQAPLYSNTSPGPVKAEGPVKRSTNKIILGRLTLQPALLQHVYELLQTAHRKDRGKNRARLARIFFSGRFPSPLSVPRM